MADLELENIETSGYERTLEYVLSLGHEKPTLPEISVERGKFFLDFFILIQNHRLYISFFTQNSPEKKIWTPKK